MKEKRSFYIAKIEEENKPSNEGTIRIEEKKTKFEKFASSYSGYNNEDKIIYPYVKYNNKGRQYEDLKDKKYRKDDNNDYGGIPSYLRREEPVMTKRNIEDLKGTKPSKEEIERQNLQNYGIYSAQKIVNNQNKDEENSYEENFTVNNQQNDYDNDYTKPEKDKRSTLVVTPKQYSRGESNIEDIAIDLVPAEKGQVGEYDDSDNYDLDKNNNQNDYNNNNNSNYMNNNQNDYNYSNNNSNYVNNSQIEQPKASHSRSRKYKFPSTNLLNVTKKSSSNDYTETNMQRITIDNTLAEFKIGGHVEKFTKGPTVTQFEVKLDPGVKPERVESIFKSLQMNLASESLRIEAPIAGKPAVGIEVPNETRETVFFSELISDKEFLNDGKPMNVVLGKLVDGRNKYMNIVEMPHVLIAGTTGSGKTVCIHSILTSIIYKASPDEVKLLLIDPKRNELLFFRELPHLACPIITDATLAGAALKWAVDEMERRYTLLESTFKKDIVSYNDAIDRGLPGQKLPYILIVIDEFADLMSSATESFEINVQRIAQKARSIGIHMVIATQRPTTDVVKGTIKANFQGRIAFRVNQQIDSMTILDHGGAEKLLGKGDMLFNCGSIDVRVQNTFISDVEIDRVTDKLREENSTNYIFDMDDLRHQVETTSTTMDDPRTDELFERVAKYVVAFQRASVNQITKAFGVGFNRADSIMSGLERLGVVSSAIPGRQRDVLIESEEELEKLLNNN